jgi:peroxiredoxin
MYSARKLCLSLVLLVLAGCGDNLIPSGADKRPPVQAGSTGPSVGQQAPDFSVPDSNGTSVTLASALASRKAIVLYFTMWCPVCDSHMSHLRDAMPQFPGVGFYAVDYVSGSVTDAAISASANGFAGSFRILADTGHTLQNSLQGTMGTTVVIDSAGTIRFNEDYQNGSRLAATLAALP